MFHPNFLNLFFGNSHSMTETMQLISAFKVEQDLQQAWKEEREREVRSGLAPLPAVSSGANEAKSALRLYK